VFIVIEDKTKQKIMFCEFQCHSENATHVSITLLPIPILSNILIPIPMLISWDRWKLTDPIISSFIL